VILVDPIREYSRGPRGMRLWCHMATDDLLEAGMDELHELAGRIGLQPQWIHRNHRLPHYDLTPEARETALALGVQEVSTRELVVRCRKPR